MASGRNAAVKDAGPPNSPVSARPFENTDEQLSAELRKWTGTTPAPHPVGELLDRHWEAVFGYARLCTDGPRSAGMLTTAAFTRLFGESLRQVGPPTSAWRPQLLVTVRRIAAEWDGDGRQELLHAALRSSAAGERAAARLLPPSDRRLLSRAFQRLPQTARALLWHTEVEAEPLTVPVALLGLDERVAGVELRRARERLREECLQVHRELAPQEECLRYVRMLDVTYRRTGVDVDPDLGQHLGGCAHCRHTADQLNQFNGLLGIALAEAVLGWGAQEYVASRVGPAAEPAEDRPAPHPPAGPPGGESFGPPAGAPAESPPGAGAEEAGRRPSGRRAAPRRPFGGGGFGRPVPSAPRARAARSAERAARRVRRRNLALAATTVSTLVVLPFVLWSVLGPGHGTTPGPGTEPGRTPGSGPTSSDPSWIGASASAQGTLRGRLHNLASGRCVGVAGKKAVDGAEAELAPCSSTASQQWAYESDGLLRNAAAPDLCLDSHLGYSVRLAPCAGAAQPRTRNVRYDFTLQGALVPRWNQDLALVPAATDGSGALVVKTRSAGEAQRWVIDTSRPELRMQVVNWGTDDGPSPTATAEPPPGAEPAPSASPAPSATRTPAPRPTPSGTGSTGPCTGGAGHRPYPYPGTCSWDGWYGGGGYGSGGGHGGR
ncbi:ricin-type beta-trefoil lectin domain protein [Streptomyces sp. NPDC004629]|uniref:RICIN domain-containing protein n=1 Tax=Streptomyces sp. NPDC004629 TaxID=3364705 RepID=UPI00369E703B